MTLFLAPLGYRPDPPSSDDKKFSELHNKLGSPQATDDLVDNRQFCSSVFDQLQVNSCTGNASVGALEMLEIVQGLTPTPLSRLFSYYNGRAGMQPNECDKDEGAYIRTIMEGLHRFGVCEEQDWSYDVSSVLTRPTWDSYRTAYKHKVNAYYRVDLGVGDYTITALEQACKATHPIIFGAEVFESIRNCSGVITMPQPNEKLLGGHAMVLVGYDRPNRMFILRNSWGSGWGSGGYAMLPYDYMTKGYASDAWVPTLFE